MRISELGEFGLIDLIGRMLDVDHPQERAYPGKPRLVIGVGDDTAAWQLDRTTELATTDTMVQNVHFSFDTATWRELGWKALAVNMSDIAAMGGFATFALVTLGLPGDTQVQDVTELYTGMLDAGALDGVVIAGGDMVSSPVVFVSITLNGVASLNSSHEPTMLLRSGARAGDLIAVTGSLGTSAAGLRMLSDNIEVDASTQSVLRQAHLTPIPRMKEGRTLVGAGIKAAMDISDGLVIDLQKICRASRVGARIFVDKLPIHPMVRADFPSSFVDLALSGGEDYELLFTCNERQIEYVRNAGMTYVTVIGEITSDAIPDVKVIDESGNERPLARTGWDHFTV